MAHSVTSISLEDIFEICVDLHVLFIRYLKIIYSFFKSI